jgi:hypothetical protein
MKINEGLFSFVARAGNILLIKCCSHRMGEMNTLGDHTKSGVLLPAVRLQKGS